MSTPNENTADVTAARRALIDSRRGTARTSSVMAGLAVSLDLVKAWRQENHIAPKMRAIIRGENYTNADL